MDLQLQDKRAVVTGGSSGIGKAVAYALAKEGCDVAICARRDGPLRDAASEIAAASGRRIIPLTCDTTDPNAINQFMSAAATQLGGIEILVNCAAKPGGTLGNIETVTDEAVLGDFEEKVLGYLRCAREAIPYMKQGGWGRIVNISGTMSRQPYARAVSGAIRNIGVTGLSKTMALHLAQFGINVMTVFPGSTVTESSAERWADQAAREGITAEAVEAREREDAILKRLIYAEDVANVVAFLCSPLAVSLTGEAIVTNGGESLEIHN